ncbi:hypothetical protein Pth03_66580 [Planotetraspora thailandica]|uniref:Uncharacterized protein n=1 Tax=Planotetraspora thailandica TaxID=487172 RepID=A0A8J3XZY4_9ACTN|nr:hypothetical protein [Planotetraspora thailandica]GII58269.1 hypothetical protein Pth03_66580 [Planotetraspora thailandica]
MADRISTTGLVPPEPPVDGVTEIRLHGVGGATPQSLLGDHPLQQTGGDAIAGFYRRPDAGGRHIEAYSWGGLTSRSGTRVLWLLLLPFLLANLAGWMLPPGLLRRRRTFALYRAAIRWAALGVTLNAVLFLTWIPVDYLAYQCGADSTCTDAWPLQIFHAVQAHPGRRILIAAAVPLLAIATMLLLTRRTLSRYESVRPPVKAGEHPEPEPERSSAALVTGLAHPGFWDGRRAAVRLGTAHLAAAVAMVAALIAHTVRSTVNAELVPVAPVALALSGLVLAGVAVVLVAETRRPWPEKLAAVALGLAVAALALAAVFAWAQPPAASPGGELPGMGQAVNLTNGLVSTSLALVLLTVLAGTAVRAGGWLLITSIVGVTLLALGFMTLAGFSGARLVAVLALAAALGVAGRVARRTSDGFRWAAPFVVMALAVGVLNIFMLGLLIRVADIVGEIHYPGMPVLETTEPVITLFPIIRSFAPYLVVLPAAVVLAFAIWQGVLLWRAARPANAERIRQEYLARESDDDPPFDGPPAWVASAVSDSAVADPEPRDLLRVRSWARTVALWQRVARAPLDLDLLFTGMVVTGVFLVVSLEADDGMVAGVHSWMIGLGTTIATALPLFGIALLRAGWNDLGRRKVIGVLWDVGTFWPRSYHPFAPPSYAERAVPDLQRRIWWLHDNGGQVLLTAHSQGSVVAAAALAQAGRRDPADQVSLVTLGSPLHKLYNWGFPAYFNQEVLSRLRVVRWVNLYYATDYVGGPVTAGPVCADVELPDPPTSRFRYGEPPPQVGSHTGYWDDPALWSAVDQVAASLAEGSADGAAITAGQLPQVRHELGRPVDGEVASEQPEIDAERGDVVGSGVEETRGVVDGLHRPDGR